MSYLFKVNWAHVLAFALALLAWALLFHFVFRSWNRLSFGGYCAIGVLFGLRFPVFKVHQRAHGPRTLAICEAPGKRQPKSED